MAKAGSGYNLQAGDGQTLSDTVNTGFSLDMQRKLYRWSAADPDKRFADLFNIVCDRRTLLHAWERLARNRGSNTPGTDRVTRKAVEERPDGVAGFLEDIRKDLRQGSYRPQPVRQRLIPKPGKPGKFRPLGIPTLKDRLVQMALKLVLEPIFEADFYPISYGFRPGRSTHDALSRVRHKLNPTSAGPSRTQYVIEGDIKGCFDAIDHHVLMDRVRRRIQDHKVLRLVLAFLKADIMIEGSLRHPVTGTPQGGIISPMRSNIFLHHVLDKWFEDVVRPRRRGKATLVRFADDFVMTFETHYDAKLVMDVLGKRLGRFGLTLHPDKTRFIDFRPQRHGGTPPDCKAQSFDFLGFTHAWQKSRKGKDVVRRTTAKSRFARSLVAVKEWCRTNRHRPAREQRAWLSAVLNGHYAYYGITGNIRRIQEYRYQVERIWHKWLERRTPGRVLIWANFRAFLARHPLPVARIIHRYTSWNESLA